MTLDEAIELLEKLKAFSKAGGHDQHNRINVLLSYFTGMREREREDNESIDIPL